MLGTATEVVRRVGLLEQVHERGTGKRGTCYVDSAGRVRVSIDSETFNGVGADGAHSNTRGLVFGPESPFLRHMGYYISIYTMAKAIFAWASDRLDYDYRDTARRAGLLLRCHGADSDAGVVVGPGRAGRRRRLLRVTTIGAGCGSVARRRLRAGRRTGGGS
ncbi:hypothetical protein [Nocardia nova]|uniref:hypothetical protein n=1 Tax=Nocardia nova TaxID=37330 RepID=UPI0021570B73|nr:hypothetical protein [Nocardia nova]